MYFYFLVCYMFAIEVVTAVFVFVFSALSMLGTTGGLFAIPWCKRSLLLTALMSLIGAAMGVLDTGE